MFSSKGNWIVCENQEPFDYTTRVKAFMEQIGTGPGNWTIRLLLRSVTRRTVADPVLLRRIQRADGQTVWVPRAPVATVNAAVSVCADALTYPVARAFALLGRGASFAELHELRQPLRSALTLP
jgi:hypothetical protein